MSVVYWVETPPAEYPVTLAEAKLHCRIDDDVAGSSAFVTFGTSNAQLVLRSKTEGVAGNDLSAMIVDSGNNTPLSVSFASEIVTINLATDVGGTPTSTVNDVIAALVNNVSIAQRITATSGVGNGTGLLAAASETSFAGGVDGTSYEDSKVTALLQAATHQAEQILRKYIVTQTIVQSRTCLPGGRNCIELEWGKVQSVEEFRYYDQNGNLQTLTSPYTLFELQENSTPAQLNLLPGQYWPSTQSEKRYPIEIEYVVGYGNAAAVPQEIKQAILFMVGHWYSNRENVQISSGLTALVVPQMAEWILWPLRDFRF